MLERVILTLFAATLLLLPNMAAQHYPPPRPLCASQFALASYACALLPYSPLPTPSPSPPAPSPPDDDDDDEEDGDDGDDGDDGGDDGGDDDGGDGQSQHGHSHTRRHGHAHGHGHGHSHKQQHHRRHRHGHRHHHRDSPVSPQEDGCCKWLAQLDNQCVCELLLLRLPSFLLKPAHAYSVFVGETCNITFACTHP